MFGIISALIATSLMLIVVRLLRAHNQYEKAVIAHLAFSHILLLIITLSSINISSVIDIVLILFLLQLAAILLLIKFKKHSD